MSTDVKALSKCTALLHRTKSNPELVNSYSVDDYMSFFDAFFALVEAKRNYHQFNGIHMFVEKQYRKFLKPVKEAQRGYIYLLKAITPGNYYKIGLSKDPVTRIESMGVKLPFPIEPLHTFETDNMYQTESILHERFADKRVNGEWFELAEGDVNYFRSICGWFDGKVYHE